MRVLNPRVIDVSIDQKVIFIGQSLAITVNSFEPNNQSYTIDFYKENKITKEMITLYSENYTMDSEECEIEIPMEVNEEIKKGITEVNIRIGRDDNFEYRHPEIISLISKPLFT